MKSYTDLEQSRKLTEILPPESADMYYYSYMSIGEPFYMSYPNVIEDRQRLAKNDIPCWSLTALLDVLPKQIGRYTKTLYWFDDAWHCEYVDEDSEGKYGVTTDNPVDAVFEMVYWLLENKKL